MARGALVISAAIVSCVACSSAPPRTMPWRPAPPASAERRKAIPDVPHDLPLGQEIPIHQRTPPASVVTTVCKGTPASWEHINASGAPHALSEIPIRRPFVLAEPTGLLVVSPESSGRYDLAKRVWTKIDALQTPHGDYGLPDAIRGDDDLYFVGRDSADGGFGYFTRLNLRDRNWHPLPMKDAPSARLDSLQAFGQGVFLVFGGRSAIGANAAILADGATFDPKTQRWTAIAPPPAGRGTEAIVALRSGFFFWPQMQRYDARGGVWTAARTEGHAEPYQAQLFAYGDTMIALGGMLNKKEAAEYDASTDHWTVGPTYAPEHQVMHLPAVVKGVPVLVPLATYAGQGLMERTVESVTIPPATHCAAWTYEFARVDHARKAWDTSKRDVHGDCQATIIVASDSVLVLEPARSHGGRAMHAWDPTTGTWRHATLPDVDGPPSAGHLRWDGRALWQWGAWTYTTVPHPCPPPVPGQPICDPTVEAHVTPIFEAWRIEPAWCDAGG